MASLNMRDAKIVSRNPDRNNIKYSKVLRPATGKEEHLDEILSPMVNELLEKKLSYPLTIMYTDTSIISYAFSFLRKRWVMINMLVNQSQKVGYLLSTTKITLT